MAAEEHNGGRSPSDNPTIRVAHSLDSLARDLANGSVSRRKVLRLLGGVLLGTILASIPGMALAKPKPDKCTKNSHRPSGKAALPPGLALAWHHAAARVHTLACALPVWKVPWFVHRPSALVGYRAQAAQNAKLCLVRVLCARLPSPVAVGRRA